jgi:DNA-binding CsgD family transcriptional regulator
MPIEPQLSESDVRAMVHLMAEVAINPGDFTAKKRQLMDGLCHLIGADLWVWVASPSLEPGKQPVYLYALHGGFDQDQFGRYMKAVDHPDMAVLTAPWAAAVAASDHVQVTRTVQQVDPELTILDRPVGALWRAADIGAIIVSGRRLAENLVSGVAAYRRYGRPLFNERESRIAHILLTEVPWLHQVTGANSPLAAVPLVSNRERSVLNLLIHGLSRKQIAAGLSLSEHTVNDYVKAVYRHFGVNSQVQLASRFLRGDGGDVLRSEGRGSAGPSAGRSRSKSR